MENFAENSTSTLITRILLLLAAAGWTGVVYADGYRSDTRKQQRSADMRLDRSTVEDVQWALSSRGYDVSVDGVIGPKTRAALEKFQRDEGLSASGRVDQSTLNALNVDIGEIERMPAEVPPEEDDFMDEQGTKPRSGTIDDTDSDY